MSTRLNADNGNGLFLLVIEGPSNDRAGIFQSITAAKEHAASVNWHQPSPYRVCRIVFEPEDAVKLEEVHRGVTGKKGGRKSAPFMRQIFKTGGDS